MHKYKYKNTHKHKYKYRYRYTYKHECKSRYKCAGVVHTFSDTCSPHIVSQTHVVHTLFPPTHTHTHA